MSKVEFKDTREERDLLSKTAGDSKVVTSDKQKISDGYKGPFRHDFALEVPKDIDDAQAKAICEDFSMNGFSCSFKKAKNGVSPFPPSF